jgi:hypothetical protein
MGAGGLHGATSFGDADRCGLDRIRRLRLVLVAYAALSMVLPSLQENCIDQQVSSGKVCLRQPNVGGLFLQKMRQLGHDAQVELALCGVFFEGYQSRSRVHFWHGVENAKYQ